MVISRIRMMKAGGGGGGGVFNFPPTTMFKRKKSKLVGRLNKKKKKKVSSNINTSPNPSSTSISSRYNGVGDTNTISSSSSHYSSFSIGRCTTNLSTINCSNGDGNWLIFEILTRLPVKSLFRFKSVCKNWCSLIQEDQQIIDLHFTRPQKRFPARIFIVIPLPRTEEQQEALNRLRGATYYDSWPYIEYHITADLLFEEEEEEQVYDNNNGVLTGQGTKLKLVVDTVREINSSSYSIISKPINGLICLINDYQRHGARIRNICTGEVSPWFHSTFGVEKRYVSGLAFYGFGFDPTTDEYKLICMWNMQRDPFQIHRYKICEVLTIRCHGNNINNNSRWRRIDDVPPYSPSDDYVYANGVIYWTTFSLFFWDSERNYRPVYLVAFDVGSEKFRTITVPDFILDQFVDRGNYFGGIAKLFELNGNLAMVVLLHNCTFKMYIYEDNDYKDKKDEINGTSTSLRKKNGRWSEASSITLPLHMERNYSVEFHTFVGSDDKIFVTSVDWGFGEKEKHVSLYCYNWKKGSWTKVDVSGIPSSVPQLCHRSFSTTFPESLLSVNNPNAL